MSARTRYRNAIRIPTLVLAIVTAALSGAGLSAARPGTLVQHPAPQKDPAAELFAGTLVRIVIELPPESAESLRREPRTYVPARATVAGQPTWTSLGIKLKGSAGSFQDLDDRPGFTLDLDRYGEAPEFYGLKKFHLNNGAQDDSLLHEWLGASVFADAGYVAPRVAHAQVTLDGRDLGFYVLRESFDAVFRARCFGETQGNLYDGGFCQDIDAELEKDGGHGPDDRSDLCELLAICEDEDDASRRDRLAAAVDIDALIDFVALEAMLGHWDGYSLNRNNYRLYFRGGDGLAQFLPHGMDQLFGETDASILRHPPGIVAAAVLADPTWRKQYRARIRALLPWFAADHLTARIDALERRLVPAMRRIDEGAARDHERAVDDLKARVAARSRSLIAQSRAPEPKPLEFRGERPITIKGWNPAGESDGITLRKKSVDGNPSFELACADDGEQVGAWRTTVLLARGRYRLSAGVRTARLEATAPESDGVSHGGAYLAVDDARSERIAGDRRWRSLTCEFEVGEHQREVELALRMRALGGSAWFRIDTLQIVRIGD